MLGAAGGMVWRWLAGSVGSGLGRRQGAGCAGRGAWACAAGRLVVTAPDVAARGRGVAGGCGAVAVGVARRVVCARGRIALCFIACPVATRIVGGSCVCATFSPVA